MLHNPGSRSWKGFGLRLDRIHVVTPDTVKLAVLEFGSDLGTLTLARITASRDLVYMLTDTPRGFVKFIVLAKQLTHM